MSFLGGPLYYGTPPDYKPNTRKNRPLKKATPAPRAKVSETYIQSLEPKKPDILLKKPEKLNPKEQELYNVAKVEYQKKLKAWQDRIKSHQITEDKQHTVKKKPHLETSSSIQYREPTPPVFSRDGDNFAEKIGDGPTEVISQSNLSSTLSSNPPLDLLRKKIKEGTTIKQKKMM
jgi:hypothetical protein